MSAMPAEPETGPAGHLPIMPGQAIVTIGAFGMPGRRIGKHWFLSRFWYLAEHQRRRKRVCPAGLMRVVQVL